MARGFCLLAVVVFAVSRGASESRAAEQIGPGDFDSPTEVALDEAEFGKPITDDFPGINFNGSLFGSGSEGAAGPVENDRVTVTFETTQTRVGFEFFPGVHVTSVTALFFRSGDTAPTDSLAVGFQPDDWNFFGAEDPLGIDSMVLELTADGTAPTLSLFNNFVFEFAASGPRISVDPTEVVFRDLLLGESATETISITNRGTSDLEVTGISDPGGDFSITVPATLPLAIAPGQSSTFDITYTPSTIGEDAATITIDSDDPGGSVDVTVTGNAVGVAGIEVTPTALDFGAVLVGASRKRSFTVSNPGTATLNVIGVTDPGGDFSLVPVSPGALPPGGSLEVEVDYTPSDVGADSAVITVASDAGNIQVTLEGQGITSSPIIAVDPEAISFGDVFVGSFAEVPLKITNAGDAILRVSRISLEGATPPPRGPFDLPLISGDFPPAFPILVAPGATKTLMVRFTPTDTVESLDQVEIESDDPDDPEVTVSLAGTGVAVLVPEIDVTPTTITFGGRFLESTSQRMVAVRNAGTGNLIITTVELTPPSSPAFGLTGAPEDSVTLEPGAALNVQAQFSPGLTGTHSGTIVIASSDPDEPEVRVVLSGVGVFQNKPEIEVEPLSVDFGEQFVGATSTREVVVRNVGTLDLDVMSMRLGDGSSTDFSVVGDPAFTLVGGSERTVEVTFTPNEVAVASGTLRIESSDADEPVTTVSLEGRGIPVPKPRIAVRTPPTLLFSEVLVGTSSALVATIQNTGVANLNVTSIALGAETTSEFQITQGPDSVELVPGAEVNIEVTYTPEAVGLDSGVLRILSDDEIEPIVNVALLGIGVGDPVPEITIITPTPTADYDLVEIGSSSSLTITIANSGTANLEVTRIALAAETGPEFEITGGPETVSLAPGAHIDVEVTYRPVDPGFDSGTLVIESLDADEAVSTVALSGTGVPVAVAQIVVRSPALEYGRVEVGSASRREVTIVNTGTAILEVGRIAVTEGSSPAFAITSGPEYVSLAPGAEFAIEVTYRPGVQTTDSGLLQIESNDTEDPVVSVSLAGTGISGPVPQIETDRAALDFGRVAIGARSLLGITLRNAGTAALAVTNIGLGEGTRDTFSIASGPSVTILAPGGEASVEVAYSPKDAVTDSGTLRLESNDAEDPLLVVSLSGTGVSTPVAQIVVDPASIDFGEVDIGTDSTRTLTIRNSGSATLMVSEILVGQGSSDRFTVAVAPGDSRLDPGRETTARVTYTPDYPRADSATLRVLSSDDHRPVVTISLFGVGVGDILEDIFKRGDANQDGEVNIADAVSTLMFLFSGGTRPGCFDASDANSDNSLDLSDALYTLNYLFAGGGRVTALGAQCDTDASPDDLPPCEYAQDLCDV